MTASTPAARLERIIGTVLRIGVTTSSACLACGAALFFGSASPLAALVFHQKL